MTVENETMNKNLSNCCLKSWIGLQHEYDNWNWSNSDPVTYTNWKRNFSCAVLQSDGSWNDSDCNAQNPFLCYNETDNSSRHFVWIDISMTWSSAQNYCQVYYTDLASIRNESENNAAMQKTQNITSWIGLFNNPWKWSDGQDFTFQNWTLQQANIYQNNETCVKVTNNGDWKAIDCNTQEPFICSDTIMNVIFINKTSTWEEAMDYCRERNSDLISISSQVEQDAIAALVNTTNSTNVWLGLRQSRLFGFWFWIDEKPLSYENWVHGPPSQLPASSPCAAMSQQNNFSWINVSCSDTYSFICRYK
uniref:C-type mannose receptor 2-like n=1 Tax=Erpetoichthys calabaricus TaxID=27687 RepID=A0A8C4STE8_ERPCA